MELTRVSKVSRFVRAVKKHISFLDGFIQTIKKQCFFHILGKQGMQDDAKMSQEKEEEEQEERQK